MSDKTLSTRWYSQLTTHILSTLLNDISPVQLKVKTVLIHDINQCGPYVCVMWYHGP